MFVNLNNNQVQTIAIRLYLLDSCEADLDIAISRMRPQPSISGFSRISSPTNSAVIIAEFPLPPPTIFA